MRILVVEDDVKFAETLSRGLRENAYAVDVSTDGEDALYRAAINDYDAILLDVVLPRADGLTICERLRTRGIRAPVLMLTARDAVSDRIAGLDAGADDYLTKPFDFGELLARLRALLRRRETVIPAEIVIADLMVDTRRMQARRGDRVLPLTTKEYALLEYLARNAGAVVSRADISAHVWDDNHDPTSNSIEVHIGRLRRKVDRPGALPLIHTRRGLGYMLSAADDQSTADVH